MKGRVLGGVALVMHEDDTVATALDNLEAGDTISTAGEVKDAEAADEIELVDDIPFGHKFSLAPIEAGERVVKYGETIGRVTEDVAPGEWVHTHTCESTRGRGDLAADARPPGGDRA